MSKEFYRGEIFYIRNESEYSGNVQGGGRPAVIISNDIGNNAGPILEVVYLTTQEKKPLPTHVKINSSKYPSTVLCEQIDTVNKDKVGDYIGQCSMAEMKKIDAALAVSIGIGINIKSNDLVKKWAEAANEAVKPDEKEPEPIAEKVEMPDIETQLEIAKITAERDVYATCYIDDLAVDKRKYDLPFHADEKIDYSKFDKYPLGSEWVLKTEYAELPVVVEEVNAFHGYISVRSTSEEDKFRYFKIRRDIEWFYDKLFPKE